MATWERSQESALARLRWHWDSAYRITNPEPFVWLAQRRDTREVLRSDSAFGLREMIIADYSERPVSRDVPP